MLYAHSYWLYAVVSLITLLAIREYNNLTALRTRDRWFDSLGVVFGVLMPAALYHLGTEAAPALMIGALFFLFVTALARGGEIKDAFLNTALKTLGVVYIALPLSYILLLRRMESGQWWILFFLTVIWFNDSFAYLVGRVLGRRKLSPVISPNKTVEGAVAGVLAGMAASVAFNLIAGLGADIYSVLFISVVIGVTALLGDLFESLIKRGAGVKDSGTIVPGHGGVLDRIDSILFPAPLLYYMLLWLRPV